MPRRCTMVRRGLVLVGEKNGRENAPWIDCCWMSPPGEAPTAASRPVQSLTTWSYLCSIPSQFDSSCARLVGIASWICSLSTRVRAAWFLMGPSRIEPVTPAQLRAFRRSWRRMSLCGASRKHLLAHRFPQLAKQYRADRLTATAGVRTESLCLQSALDLVGAEQLVSIVERRGKAQGA
jgi:hypothetical protein